MKPTIYRRAVGTTLTLIVNPANHWRELRVGGVNGMGVVFIGFDRTLNATNGFPLPANQGSLCMWLAPGQQLWAVGTDSLDEIAALDVTTPDSSATAAAYERKGSAGRRTLSLA